MEKELEDKDDYIAAVLKAKDNMEANLDCLFADLVALCKMYEFVEEKVEKLGVRNEELVSELKSEQKRREDSQLAAETEKVRLQSETERLERKLDKYRAKVDEMRQERNQREQKQRSSGPVSYINNLHDSMHSASANSSRHTRPSASQKKNPFSGALSYSREKENHRANESQRRSRTSTGDDYPESSAYRSRSRR